MESTKESVMGNATNDVVLSILSAGTGSHPSSGIASQEGSAEMKPSRNVTNESAGIGQDNVLPPLAPRKISTKHLKTQSTMTRMSLLQSKSRLVEPHYPSSEDSGDESTNSARISPKGSPRACVSTRMATAVIPKTSFGAEEEEEEEEEDEDVYRSIDIQINKKAGKKKSRKKLMFFTVVGWIVFSGFIGLAIASFINHHLRRQTTIWSVALWKWCVLVLVIISGRLVTTRFMVVLVSLVELNFLLKRKLLYFIHGLKTSVQVFLWLTLILVTWVLLFCGGNHRSKKANRVIERITVAIAGCLVGVGIWLLKTLLIKVIALSFHVNRLFDRIQGSIYHQYVLQTLSGPPYIEMEERPAKSELSFERVTKSKGVTEIINVEKLHKINHKKVSAWTMRGLIKVIRRSKLSIISYGVEDGAVKQNKEITKEWEARDAADKIFNNVASPGHKYIKEENLLRFMRMDEVNQVFTLFEGAIETGMINRSAMRKWVVNAYLERKSLAHSLDDTTTAVKQLNKIASVVVLIIDIIVWNLMMGFLTTTIVVFIGTQWILVVIIFGNTVKNVFEAIIFVFVMHPFDVGDRCVIDDVQMVVEEMNILTTVFLRHDNEKIYYPNSVLSKKPVSNFYRSPEMSDSVEFAIDFSTTVETITVLKGKIREYIESKPHHWRPCHSMQVIDICTMDKMAMGLYVNHTINFQNAAERGNRRSELVLELKKILEERGIAYRLKPPKVHVTVVGPQASSDAQ